MSCQNSARSSTKSGVGRERIGDGEGEVGKGEGGTGGGGEQEEADGAGQGPGRRLEREAPSQDVEERGTGLDWTLELGGTGGAWPRGGRTWQAEAQAEMSFRACETSVRAAFMAALSDSRQSRQRGREDECERLPGLI